MSDRDFSALAIEAKDLIEKQLTKLGVTLETKALDHDNAKALLAISKWLSEMAMIEKDEIENLSPEELRKLQQRKRRQRYLNKNEHTSETQGDSEETATENQESS